MTQVFFPAIHVLFEDDGADEREALRDRLIAERLKDPTPRAGMHSVGGWHTPFHELGYGWLGEAMARRLARSGFNGSGACWGNVMPVGSSYGAHVHRGQELVAVWMLEGTSELHIEGSELPVRDRPGQLVVFPGKCRHWVPTVTSERVTIATNLNPPRH